MVKEKLCILKLFKTILLALVFVTVFNDAVAQQTPLNPISNQGLHSVYH